MKKMNLIKVPLVALILVTFSCKKTVDSATGVQPAFDLEIAKEAIETAGQTFIIALNRGDTISLGNCYTTDAKLMIPNSKAVIGRTEIRKLFSSWIKDGMPTFTMKTIDVWGNGDIMAAEEEWTFSDKDGKIIDSGKSIELFKMEDEKWRLYRDCYNSNMPCPK
jgi:ketosteroid isomerase-like protein